MSEQLQCPMCTHEEFEAYDDGGSRHVMCRGCDCIFTLDELVTEQHGLDEICVLAPYTFSGAEVEIDEWYSVDIENEREQRQQGFHRKLAYARCLCGEVFHGEGHAKRGFEEHMDEVMLVR